MSLDKLMQYKILELDNIQISIGHLILVVLIFFIVFGTLGLIKRILKKAVAKGKLEAGNLYSIYQIIKYFVLILYSLIALQTIGFNLTVLLAGSAALLVGLGLGIQQLFNDYASGIIMLFERNVKLGDIMELEDSTVGKVIFIGLRTSKIETRDNIVLIIPNHKFINENIINWSHIEADTRFDLKVGVAYGSDVNLVKNILLSCANSHSEINKTPEPMVLFKDFGDSSLDFSLLFWTKKTWLIEPIRSDLRFAIDKAFRENGVEIPFPQTDVHIK
jgi:small-conductance mechanosensitive channel